MKCPRRSFLKAVVSVSAATVLPASFWPADAAEPIVRNGKPQFKFSLAAYSYRNLLQGENPPLTHFDFIDDCAQFDLGTVRFGHSSIWKVQI